MVGRMHTESGNSSRSIMMMMGKKTKGRLTINQLHSTHRVEERRFLCLFLFFYTLLWGTELFMFSILKFQGR